VLFDRGHDFNVGSVESGRNPNCEPRRAFLVPY
jgi:hypothetical protein